MFTVLRFSIANIPQDVLISSAQAAGLSGTISPNVGFTPTWGTEAGHTVETATSDPESALLWAADVCRENGESAAYFTTDGAAPRLVWSDGRITLLDDSLTVERLLPVAVPVAA